MITTYELLVIKLHLWVCLQLQWPLRKKTWQNSSLLFVWCCCRTWTSSALTAVRYELVESDHSINKTDAKLNQLGQRVEQVGVRCLVGVQDLYPVISSSLVICGELHEHSYECISHNLKVFNLCSLKLNQVLGAHPASNCW